MTPTAPVAVLSSLVKEHTSVRLVRRKVVLTLLISTVQLRLVVSVWEWDSAFSGMMAAARRL
ncbi:hypothetical protein EYF80_056700 [Liparis tanakae]|uniref:Uncharacterized protein n=1 Tax=Liparis tanakae TaxID=230148 RepID=A0A4Z2EWG2_9TELE|nr:hypothetical protein EYF80_056700 [Liparis tanakae]